MSEVGTGVLSKLVRDRGCRVLLTQCQPSPILPSCL